MREKLSHGILASAGLLLALLVLAVPGAWAQDGPDLWPGFAETPLDPAMGAPDVGPEALEAPLQGPTIDVWYGDTQPFGQNGHPQTWVNILGRVSDANGVQSLSYTLTANGNGQGTVDHTPGNPYPEDTVATLTPVPATNWAFDDWEGPHAGELVNQGNGTWTLTMDEDKTVTARFLQVAYTVDVTIVGQGAVGQTPPGPYQLTDVVTLDPDPATGWSFDDWSGPDANALIDMGNGTWDLTVTGDMTVTATFTEDQYNATVSVIGNGSVEHTPGNPYTYGQTASLKPIADPRWQFKQWLGPDAGDLNDQGDGTWTLEMDGDKSVTAQFEKVEWGVDLTKIGQGDVLFTPDPPYSQGQEVTLDPSPAQGWAFDGWSGPDAGDLVDGGDGTWSVIMDADKVLTATFAMDYYTVTVNYNGKGTVDNTPGNPYTYGQTATLEPQPEAGWGFSGWDGPDADELVDQGDGTWTIVLDSDKEVRATFVQRHYYLRVTTVGGGIVQHAPGNPYLYGQTAALRPEASVGWTFIGWSGPDADELIDRQNGTWGMIVDGDKEVTATFVKNEYDFEVVADPADSGTVDRFPEQATYHYDDLVLLQPTPNTGWAFATWSGPGSENLVDNGNGTWTLTVKGNTALVAHFDLGVYQVTITTSGRGWVDHQPGNVYRYGEVATLRPIADVGYRFHAWGGANAWDLADQGDGTWTLVVDGNKEVVAQFRSQGVWDVYVPILLK